MIYILRLFLGLLVWVDQSYAQTDCYVFLTVSPTAADNCRQTSPSPLSRNLTCNSLQDALTSVSSSVQNDLVCISLSPGVHYVNYTATKVDYDVRIMGSSDGRGATVECHPSAGFDGDRYEEFPLIFGANTSVVLEGISFASCSRSLLFKGCADATVTNCHFR